MPRDRATRTAIKALQALYDSLPKLHCQGLCQRSCHITSDLVSPLEVRRLGDHIGNNPEFPDELFPDGIGNDLSQTTCIACPLLTEQGRCSQYGLRPLMCRLWGAVDDPNMQCPYGCEPPRYLSNKEASAVWDKAVEIDRRWQRETQNENHGEQVQ